MKGAFLSHRKMRPMKQKSSAWMRTRAKRNHGASDRARRENAPRHILCSLFNSRDKLTFARLPSIMEQADTDRRCRCLCRVGRISLTGAGMDRG